MRARTPLIWRVRGLSLLAGLGVPSAISSGAINFTGLKKPPARCLTTLRGGFGYLLPHHAMPHPGG